MAKNMPEHKQRHKMYLRDRDAHHPNCRKILLQRSNQGPQQLYLIVCWGISFSISSGNFPNDVELNRMCARGKKLSSREFGGWKFSLMAVLSFFYPYRKGNTPELLGNQWGYNRLNIFNKNEQKGVKQLIWNLLCPL